MERKTVFNRNNILAPLFLESLDKNTNIKKRNHANFSNNNNKILQFSIHNK